MSPYPLDQICLRARAIVYSAVQFIKQERSVFNLEKVEYKGFNDLVSYVDKVSEQILVKGLQEIIPEAGFITEENTLTIKEGRWKWIIDPLDGTTNFVHGIPCYCVSVGLMFEEEMVLGIVHEVNMDECFYGWKDGGAYLNGNRIHVSKVDHMKRSLLATGFPYTNYERMIPYMEVFDYCMHHTQGIRRLGSAAADLAYVACGRFEGFYEYGLNSYDVAAGVLLVREAGGKLGDFTGGDNFIFGKEVIATNSGIFTEFLGVVKAAFYGI